MRVERGSDGTLGGTVLCLAPVEDPRDVAQLHYGPARVPSRESPEEAVALLQDRGYTACEIDFEGKFWMEYPWAEKFGELARAAGIVLSIHAPIAGFMGHAERGKKLNMAVGMLAHSARHGKAARADGERARDGPFHIHFSDIAYATRNETKHLPYGEGTLRVEPLGTALRDFDRPATVITEAPDEASNQAIREELYAAVGTRSASRASSSSASASRSRARKNSA